MNRLLLLFFLLLVCPRTGHSQVLPLEGSKLNYRLVGFSFPKDFDKGIVHTSNVPSFQLEIAEGDITTEDSFKKHIIITRSLSAPKAIVELPAFGKLYTWRAAYMLDGVAVPGPLHHFSTVSIPYMDSTFVRVRVTTTAQQFKDAHFFLDANRALYDMQGKPVWYLPNIENQIGDKADVRDLRLTPQGTITFLLNDKRAYEINYNGDVLWSGPLNQINDPDLRYHHEFTRLANGHYMVASTEPVTLRLKKGLMLDSIAMVPNNIEKDTAHMYLKFPMSAILEYDQAGKIVWSWGAAAHFGPAGLKYATQQNGRHKFDVHLNAFFFDEKKKIMYISFRNISQVIKIKYPEGTILNTYAGAAAKAFCGQHSIRSSTSGNLYLFDNNTCFPDSMPRLLVLKEQESKKEPLKKVWEYTCTLDGMNMPHQQNGGFTSGGNIQELAGGAMFASISGPYSKVFIVSRDKKVRFAAIPEMFRIYEKKWYALPQYRATIVTDKKELERMIWSGKE